MKLINKIASLKSILKAKCFSYRIPLIVSWHLVNRCNRKCKYCYRWSTVEKELSSDEVFCVIDVLSQMGNQVIIFSGGEPLLRDDIGKIIDYSQAKGIFTGLTSNGDLVPERINEIKGLDMLKISFDGPKDVHDFLRGKGSYDNVMVAIETAKKYNIKVKFNTTLTKYNIEYIDFILEKAKQLNVKVKFQPVSHVHSAGKDIRDFFPEIKEYKQAVQRLIDSKRTNKFIINSIASLNYLSTWPHPLKLKCYAGKLICCITANGKVWPCSAAREESYHLNCLDPKFKKMFARGLAMPFCQGCWCSSTLELNCLMKFNLNTILNIRRLFD
ncbi:MAG: radical SAM protein [Candidatus Omnitrophica bacterium]|nr:radical SAM protein [Candidatus Omnitrophota bacterium]